MVIETALLAAALIEVAKKLAEKAVIDPALESGLEPFKKKLTSFYTAKKLEKELQEAFTGAIQQLGAPTDEDELTRWLKNKGLDRLQSKQNEALRKQVARALIGFSDQNAAPPEELLVALAWPRSQAKELSKLLAHLRAGLAGTNWQPLLDYAHQAEQLGLLRQMVASLSLTANAVTSTEVGAALRVVVMERLKISVAEALEIEREYRALLADEFRMHIIQGLVQVEKAVRLPLKDIYLELGLIPLDSKRKPEAALDEMLELNNAERLNRSLQEIDNRVTEALAEERNLVIVGKPGSGKTISLRFITLMLALGEPGAARLGLAVPYLPIYLRLADYAQALQERATLSLEAFLHQYLSDKYPGVAHLDQFLPEALKNGTCLVLLDGLDEVGDVGDKLLKGQTLRENVLREVQRFADQRCGERCGNRLVVTSRLEGYHRRDLPGFTETELSPLRLPDEVEGFLLRWYSAYIQAHDDQLSFETAEAQARLSVEKLMSSISLSESVKLMAINPLLLTILAIISENLHTPLPNRRAELYKIVAETLVKNWRRSNTGRDSRIYNSQIGAAEIYYMMASLAYWLHENQPGGAMPVERWRAEISRLLAEDGDEKALRELVDEFIHHATEEAGLLTERSAGQIGFFHLTLEEYLAAVEIARQDGTPRVEMIYRHWQNPRWQEVLLLTAGELELRGNRVPLETYLTTFLNLESAEPEQAGRNIYLAGRALADIGPRSVGQNAQRAIRQALKRVAQNLDPETEQPASEEQYLALTRAAAADTLDELAYLPEDLSAFVEIGKAEHMKTDDRPSSTVQRLFFAKYPVTNAQYQRFLEAEDYPAEKYWTGFPKYAEPEKKYAQIGDWGNAGYQWLQENWDERKKVLPRYWNNPRFGLSCKTAPVVGISWYEANAYCSWLSAHWDELEEGQQGLAKPKEIRLPTEAEWILAAGGEQDQRFAFGKLKDVKDLPRHANTRESALNRTTPVWMYPAGATQEGLMDMSGNVWEWQANYSSNSKQYLALRGGSWFYSGGSVRVSGRFVSGPLIRYYFIGFRVVVFALPK